MKTWTSIWLGKVFKRISTFQPKTAYIIMNSSSLTKNVQHYYITENKVARTGDNLIMYDMNLVNTS
jgi:hypothetical protein